MICARSVPFAIGTVLIVGGTLRGLLAVTRYIHSASIKHPKIRARKLVELANSIDEAAEYVGSEVDVCPPTEEDRATVARLTVLQLLYLLGDDVSLAGGPVELPSGLPRPVSAVYLLKCFLGNAIRAHHDTNCLTAIMLQDAITGAKQADEKRRSRRSSCPADEDALLGIPVSLKENILYIGTDSTIGLHSRCFKPTQPEDGDASTVRAIRAHGGVFFCKTNVPQTMLSYECHNYVFGATSCPANVAYSSGGSSGGEAALMGAGGSVLGVGSDTGGSLRIPAVFCGVAAFRPTSTMFPSRGNVATFPGQEGVVGVAGPLASTVSDLRYFHTKVLTSPLGIASSGDGNVHRLPRNAASRKGPFRIAYVLDDGLVGVSPANRRAVEEAVSALRRAGHVCVQLDALPHISRVTELFYRIVAADGGVKLWQYLRDGEVPIPFLRPLLLGVSVPRLLKPVLGWVVANKFGSPYFGGLMRAIRGTTVSELYDIIHERNMVRHAVADDLYGGNDPFDGLLAPTFPLPGIKHNASSQASFAIIIQAYFNLLDVPVAAFATTTVDRHLDRWDGIPASGLGRYVRNMYNAEKMEGLPVGVQVAAPRGEDDFCLELAEVVEKALCGH